MPPERLSLVASAFVIVDSKAASSPRAAANSFRVSSAPGAPSINAVIAESTAAWVT